MHNQTLKTRNPLHTSPSRVRSTPDHVGNKPPATQERRLSIIIPTLNEQDNIARTLKRATERGTHEIIVVDGGSRDRTLEIARAHDAIIVKSAPGRARQLSRGASVATGGTLLFLHADTILPKDFDVHVFRVLDRPGVCAGAFRLQIDSEKRSFRLVERVVNVRSRVRRMPYGDQAIFVSTDVFREAGGFPDLPIMEDYALIKRLQKMGRIEMATASVVTSGRRWIEDGVWRTTLRNQLCIAAYRLGVSPARIARWRQRPGNGRTTD